MPYDPPIRFEASGAVFTFYTPEEVRKLSVRKITVPASFDQMGTVVLNGVHDPALGPIDKLGNCRTCGLIYKQCPGHFGHIDLAEPLYNPLLTRHLISLLRCGCWYCGALRLPKPVMECATTALKLIRDGDVLRAMATLEVYEQLRIKGAADLNPLAEEGSQLTMETIWARFLPTLSEGSPSSTTTSSSASENNTKVTGVLAREEQLVHLQQMRKDLVRGVMKDMMARASQKCPSCGAAKVKTRRDDSKTKILLDGLNSEGIEAAIAEAAKNRKGSTGETEMPMKKTGNTNTTFVTPSRVKDHLRKIWNLDTKQTEFLLMVYNSRTIRGLPPSGPDMFFIEVLAVPPNRFRPVIELGNLKSENPQTALYKKIVQLNNQLIEIDLAPKNQENEQKEKEAEAEAASSKKKKSSTTTTTPAKRKPKASASAAAAAATMPNKMTRVETIVALQATLNELCVGGDPTKPPSIKDALEKKEGLFRKHMMGKRVNFAARSVISPDPFISTNEIGLPLYFSMRLCFPEPVTAQNVEQLKKLVLNGPDVYPGANFLEDEFGNILELKIKKLRLSEASRLLTISENAPRKYKIVYRHVRDGDMALVNRQPTLHKPGIMAHAIRVLGKERTIRMHYTNCSTYNADFDGDEMNIHVPQGQLPRAEAQVIAFTDEQYIVPKDGNPLRGLIQDSVITGVLLTKRDTFFTRTDYQQLMWGCLFGVNTTHPLVTPYPAIMKPCKLWTGKQLVSSVLGQVTVALPPLNLEGTAKVPGNIWGRGGFYGPSFATKKSEDMTDIWSGSNESAVIIKKNELLCGILDKSQFGASAFGLVHSCYELYGSTIAGKLLSVLGMLLVNYMQWFRGFTCAIDDLVLKPEAETDRRIMLRTANEQGREAARIQASHGSNDDEAVRIGLAEARRDETKSAMLDSCVKAAINKLASKVVEKCLPDGTIKRFPTNCMQLMTGSGARGSNVNASQISCLLGQQELEGKRVPVMLSGRTLPSFHRYDPSPRAGGFVMDRFLTGVRPQEYFYHAMAGREGLIDTAVKTSRSGYLQRSLIKSLESLCVQYDYTVRDCDGSVIQFAYGEDGLDVTRTCYLGKFRFWASNFDALVTRYNIRGAADKYSKHDVKECSAVLNECLSHPNENPPILTRWFPAERLGVMSEKFYKGVREYLDTDPDKFFSSGQVNKTKFHGLMCLKYARSLVDPGESVGLLASQSIGEPSTQMTLNTFHLAGRGDVNVTLGIPRLREILMNAKVDISTPTMTVSTHSKNEADATKLAKALSRLNLIDVIDDLTLTEQLCHRGTLTREYIIELKLKPDAQTILKDHNVEINEEFVRKLRSLERHLQLAIKKQLKLRGADVVIGFEKTKDEEVVSTAVVPEEEEEEVVVVAEENEDGRKKKKKDKKEGENEMDAEEASLAGKKEEQATYEGPDDDELEGAPKKDEEDEDEDEKEKGKEDDDEEEVVDSKKEKRKSAEREKEEDNDYGKGTTVNWEKGIIRITFAMAADSKVMMLQLVEQSVEKTVLAEVPHIKRCYVSKKSGNSNEYVVQTEGVNFSILACLESLVDLTNIYSNDIAGILSFFGVEAARRAIVNEVGGVFKVYGINVDQRHLGLIADYMTFGGGYKPFNRHGIESSTSPLLKMSFETTADFLVRSALYREVDNMNTPASCIVVGRPIKHGTGLCEIRQMVTTSVQPSRSEIIPASNTRFTPKKEKIKSDPDSATTAESPIKEKPTKRQKKN